MNCYHQYPARTAFGGDKTSGVGPENHRMMLDTDSQTTCLPVRYDPLVAAHRPGARPGAAQVFPRAGVRRPALGEARELRTAVRPCPS
jgi:hypothetical protein